MDIFIVTNSRIATGLQDNPNFKTEFTEGPTPINEIHLVGRFKDLEVYVDPYISWSDNTLYFFSKEETKAMRKNFDAAIAHFKLDSQTVDKMSGTLESIERPLTDFDAIV